MWLTTGSSSQTRIHIFCRGAVPRSRRDSTPPQPCIRGQSCFQTEVQESGEDLAYHRYLGAIRSRKTHISKPFEGNFTDILLRSERSGPVAFELDCIVYLWIISSFRSRIDAKYLTCKFQ